VSINSKYKIAKITISETKTKKQNTVSTTLDGKQKKTMLSQLVQKPLPYFFTESINLKSSKLLSKK
jgi:hypothetical protein